MMGSFSNTVDFDPGPGVFTMTGNGSNDIRLDISSIPAGAYFLEVKQESNIQRYAFVKY